MGSEWVNKFEIMRDLSMVQGCVPVDVSGTIKAGEKPPTQDIIEDTEEEFYCNWAGGDGDHIPPDLGLIKRMLDVVRDNNVASNSESEPEDVIEITKISKLNPLSEEFKPCLSAGDTADIDNEIKINKKPAPKVRRQRNMAIESLLLNIKNKAEENNKKPEENIKKPEENIIEPKKVTEIIKLLKPNDFTTKSEGEKENMSDSVNKVNGWLETQESLKKKVAKVKKVTPILNLDPTAMFKKKQGSEKKPTVSKIKTEAVKTSPKNAYKECELSGDAAEYYKQYLDRSIIKRTLQEDVWSRAERQMEEIDRRRKEEAELFALSLALSKLSVNSVSEGPSVDSSSLEAFTSVDASITSTSVDASRKSSPVDSTALSTSADFDDIKLAVVRLSKHRHELPSPCIVCAVKNKEAVNHNDTENWRLTTSNVTEDSDNWRIKDKSTNDIVTQHVHSWTSMTSKDKDDNVSSVTANKPIDVDVKDWTSSTSERDDSDEVEDEKEDFVKTNKTDSDKLETKIRCLTPTLSKEGDNADDDEADDDDDDDEKTTGEFSDDDDIEQLGTNNLDDLDSLTASD